MSVAIGSCVLLACHSDFHVQILPHTHTHKKTSKLSIKDCGTEYGVQMAGLFESGQAGKSAGIICASITACMAHARGEWLACGTLSLSCPVRITYSAGIITQIVFFFFFFFLDRRRRKENTNHCQLQARIYAVRIDKTIDPKTCQPHTVRNNSLNIGSINNY